MNVWIEGAFVNHFGIDTPIYTQVPTRAKTHKGVARAIARFMAVEYHTDCFEIHTIEMGGTTYRPCIADNRRLCDKAHDYLFDVMY